MKKLLIGILGLVLVVSLTGCGNSSRDENTLVVAATSKPHSDILESTKPILKEEYGIDWKLKF